MSDQYIGEIRFFPYVRGAPSGWLACDGSLQAIAQYEGLAALLGTTYGGDGQSQFALPDLRGRVPIGAGAGYPLGAQTGTETVTLGSHQMPPHNHFVETSATLGTTNDPTGMVLAGGPPAVTFYDVPGASAMVAMATGMVGIAGQGLPHDNCAPTLPIVACICFAGVWPPNSN